MKFAANVTKGNSTWCGTRGSIAARKGNLLARFAPGNLRGNTLCNATGWFVKNWLPETKAISSIIFLFANCTNKVILNLITKIKCFESFVFYAQPGHLTFNKCDIVIFYLKFVLIYACCLLFSCFLICACVLFFCELSRYVFFQVQSNYSNMFTIFLRFSRPA